MTELIETDSIEGRGIAVSNEELRFSSTMP